MAYGGRQHVEIQHLLQHKYLGVNIHMSTYGCQGNTVRHTALGNRLPIDNQDVCTKPAALSRRLRQRQGHLQAKHPSGVAITLTSRQPASNNSPQVLM